MSHSADSALRPESHPSLPGAVSDAQLAANRANARHSTGPRTPEGKARSAQNALKHGLFSAALGYAAAPLQEERAGLDALLQGLRRDHGPVGTDEEAIVDRMAASWWELARVHRLGQVHLRTRLDEGFRPVEVMKEMALFGAEQARLERSLTRQRKDLWLLQGRHQGVVDRAGRKAAAAYERLVAAQDAETAAIRARTEVSATSDASATSGAAAPDGAPHLPASAPPGGEEGTHDHRPERGTQGARNPEFRTDFLDDTPPQGPTNGSGRAAGIPAGSGD